MENTIKELARFLGKGEDEVRESVLNYRPTILGDEWRKANPSTPKEVDNFYRQTDKYLIELIPWNYSEVFFERVKPLNYYHGKRILEVGAGIGSLCISMALNGNEVTYCDINESNYAFAKQRFADRLLPIAMTKSLKGQRDFDMVVAIDTLEHIHPDALPKFIKDISHCLKDGGFLYHRSNFSQQGDTYPMHYDHSETLRHIATDTGLVLRPNGDFVKGDNIQGVQISIPLRGEQHSVGLTQNLMSLHCPPATKLATCKNKPVDVARNYLAKILDRDWLFFMDSDQTFPDGALQRLLSWNLDIVSGVVFQRGGKPIPMIYKYAFEKDKGNYYTPMVKEIKEYLDMQKAELNEKEQAICLPPYGVLEVDGVSAGCLLINHRVFDELEEPYFKVTGESFGEDFYFCRKAQAAGFKIYADPSVMCGHFSTYERGYHHFLAWANKAEFPWSKNPEEIHGSASVKVE